MTLGKWSTAVLQYCIIPCEKMTNNVRLLLLISSERVMILRYENVTIISDFAANRRKWIEVNAQ